MTALPSISTLAPILFSSPTRRLAPVEDRLANVRSSVGQTGHRHDRRLQIGAKPGYGW